MMPARTAEEVHVPTLAALWSAVLVVPTLGTWLLFRARPGVNWPLVTLSVALAFRGCVRLRVVADARTARPVPGTLLMAVVLAQALAMGAALTADATFHVMIAVAVSGLLAIGIELKLSRLAALARLGREFLRRLEETVLLTTSSRWRPLVRGVALALPVVGLFSLSPLA